MAAPILEWWTGKTLAEIHKETCRDYVKWRVKQPIKQQCKNTKPKAIRRVSEGTARHELSMLSAALHHFHADPRHGPLDAMSVVELPPKPGQREDYFLTWQQIAARVRAARRRPESRHLARMLLIGFYTGTRPGAILKLKWLQSTDGGHFDLDAGILHRKPAGAKESKKRAPKCRIHDKLRVLLGYWRKADRAKGVVYVVHYQGTIRSGGNRAGHQVKDGPHILRHFCATWLMQQGESPFEAGGYLGMSPQNVGKRLWPPPAFQANVASYRPIPNKKRAAG